MDLNTLAPFLTWQFVLSAVLINAAMLYVKRFVTIQNPGTLSKRWFKSLLTIANPILGVGIALIPNFLYGERFVERLFIGICAGFLSHFIYSLVVKRVLQKKPTENSTENEKGTE
jgi:hypothetical protein